MRARCPVSFVVLLAVASCGSPKSPWARKMPKAERVAWPAKCGIPVELVKSRDGQGDYAYTSHEGQLNAEPPSTLMIACDMSWNRDKDRLADLRVYISRVEPVLTAADVEPLLTLALAELRPADQAVARRLAAGERSRESSGGLDLDGGFGVERRNWTLVVQAR